PLRARGLEGKPGRRALLDHHHDACAVRPLDPEAALTMNMRAPAFNLALQPRPVRLAGKRVLVLGLGDTGLAVARWVAREGGTARAADTRATPPRAADLAQRVPEAELRCGPFDPTLLEGVELVVPSPGLALYEPLIQRALNEGVALAGEIEL